MAELDKISLITKRDVERRLDLQKRHNDRNDQCAGNEKIGYFEETFASKRAYIERLLKNSVEIDKLLLPEHFNDISKEILILQKYVAASNIFLRTYDIKRCQEALNLLTDKAKDLEEQLLPKKKFGFKNKSKPKPQHSTVENSKDETDCSVQPDSFSKTLCDLSHKTGQELILTNKDIFKKDVAVEYLDNCKVKVYGSPSTLHLNHLKNCQVFTGPVSTSIFADNCDNCTLVIACQQLRLHSSKNIEIYLHVTSRAIMEDCHKIFLAPYNWCYRGLEEDFKSSGLDMATNHWKSVDDFNWLNVEKQSPNWSVLEHEVVEN